MTSGRRAVLVVSTLTCLGCTQHTPELQVIHDAAEAMGGDDNIAEVQNLVLQGSGRQYRFGQSPRLSGEPPYWEIDDYRRDVDLEHGRWRVTQARTSAFLTMNPVLREEQAFGLDGAVAYDIGPDGVTRRAGDEVARERTVVPYHHPVALLRLALSDGTTVANVRQEEGHAGVDITAPDGDMYTLWVDNETNYPSRIVSTGYHPTLGDVTFTTTFDDYRETGGFGGFQARLTLPRTISARTDDWPTWDLLVTSDVDQDIGDLSAPANVLAAAATEFQANVQVEEVADGVWCLAGQSHHSVLVEFDEFLALIEAPQHDARTLAVIEAARELAPNKPLRYLVNTHHHFDHSGGIRAAVSEGLTIITHESNRSFYEELVARPHTRQPDALARRPQELTLELVTGYEEYDLSDGRRTMRIKPIFQDEHSAGHLMVYLPRERILVEADAFVPNASVAPFAPNLLKYVSDLGWRVDTIVPIHGAVVEFARLEEAVEAEENRF